MTDGINDRHFFSDVSRDHADTYDGYNKLMRDGSYQEASDYIHDNANGLDYNGAYLWNKYDSIIRALEEYALEMDSVNYPYYSVREPDEKYDGMIWIT